MKFILLFCVVVWCFCYYRQFRCTVYVSVCNMKIIRKVWNSHHRRSIYLVCYCTYIYVMCACIFVASLFGLLIWCDLHSQKQNKHFHSIHVSPFPLKSNQTKSNQTREKDINWVSFVCARAKCFVIVFVVIFRATELWGRDRAKVRTLNCIDAPISIDYASYEMMEIIATCSTFASQPIRNNNNFIKYYGRMCASPYISSI